MAKSWDLPLRNFVVVFPQASMAGEPSWNRWRVVRSSYLLHYLTLSWPNSWHVPCFHANDLPTDGFRDITAATLAFHSPISAAPFRLAEGKLHSKHARNELFPQGASCGWNLLIHWLASVE